ncbi:MAG: endoglucanase [Candidatus Marinimicrobia bacterium CG08_land_8_20_14_0_20_45_22]|nr:MAG: endoglucanase [Candidatus Marinimicrobia bacterium CG08_land_8_20_14_0_20_45_22]
MFILVIFFATCVTDADTQAKNDDDTTTVYTVNRLLAPGINLGNALEAPNEGEWGVTIQDSYFDTIKSAGFNAVRIPIRWSAHAAADSPYTISPVFMNRVRHVVSTALTKNLAVVINIHHYDEIFQSPSVHQARFLSLWRQIGVQFKDASNHLVFEILNEPHDQLTASLWNEYLSSALAVIRETNPHRTVIIGVAEWGGLAALNKLSIPESDTNLIVTLHYYEPFSFTHQGAEWVTGSNEWLGTTWMATTTEKSNLEENFDQIKVWADDHHRPIFIGEFGAYSKADMTSRALWTQYVVSACQERDFSWAYWEFCSGFGAFDTKTGTWRQSLLNALIQSP